MRFRRARVILAAPGGRLYSARDTLAVLAMLGLGACAPRSTDTSERVQRNLSLPRHLSDQYDLSPWLDWVEEGHSPLGVPFPFTADAERKFQPVVGAKESLGFRAPPVWFRLRVTNTADVPARGVLELGCMPNVAELYRQDGSHLALLSRSGTNLAFDQRPVQETWIAFRIVIDALRTTTFFLRVQSNEAILARANLWSEPAFARLTASRSLVQGLYFGLLIVMIVYNGFIYVSTRERTYLLYVLFETAMFLYQAALDKVAFQYLWPHAPAWAQSSEQIFASLTILAAIRFTLAFLDLRRYAPRLARALRVMSVAAALLAALSALTTHPLFPDTMGAFFIGCLLTIAAASVRAVRNYQPNARFFLLGWTPLLCGSVLAVFEGLGLVFIEADFLPFLAFKVGSAAEATILALALANRINLMRREREQAHSELLATRTAQSTQLEQHVAARTQQLSEALDRLKLAQDKLIRQERLTSLAGMVAGMAHEVGNPLNFAHGGADVLRDQIEGLARTWRHLRDRVDAANADVVPVGDTHACADQMNGLLAGASRAVGLVDAGLQRIGKIMTNLRGYMQLRVLESRPTDLVEEIESTLAMVDDTLVRHGVTIVKHLAPLPPFRCRPGELNQVFMNIVLNACNAMSGGGRIEITTRADTGTGIEIQFADTGPGVAPALRDAIFEPFFSEKALDGSGTGLGLYIAREIVARHGGQLVLLDSARGACFAVRLPSSAEPGIVDAASAQVEVDR